MVRARPGSSFSNGGRPLDGDVLMGMVLPDEDKSLPYNHARLIFLDGHTEELNMASKAFQNRRFVPFPDCPEIKLAVRNE